MDDNDIAIRMKLLDIDITAEELERWKQKKLAPTKRTNNIKYVIEKFLRDTNYFVK
jgi:hypothetical protein